MLYMRDSDHLSVAAAIEWHSASSSNVVVHLHKGSRMYVFRDAEIPVDHQCLMLHILGYCKVINSVDNCVKTQLVYLIKWQ